MSRRLLSKNCRASYKIGKMVREKMDDVAELQSKANFSVVAEPLPSPPDDKVRSVGLYGMGGVGKTTLLNRINNEFLKSRVGFDAVIWGDCVQTSKCGEVGIPPVNDGNKSKVVFTTRFSTVCRDMGAKGIEVKCLAWEEAFALFQAYVGEDTIYSHPHIPKLAETAAKECDGLPLALITLDEQWQEQKTPEEWEKKIQMLKNYPAKFPGLSSLQLFSVMDSDELPAEIELFKFGRCDVQFGKGSPFNIPKASILIHLAHNCDSLEEVIEVDESGVSEIESDLGLFSRLTHLHLRILQKLRSICGWSLLFPSLKVIHVVRCPNLRKLPFDSNIGISKNLEEIEGEGEWWDELEWEDQTIMHNLGPYFKPL
ncbi:putative disease resistance protein [Vitis vinifera]|uniref:Putative disease resistance protein n=1 Tax=Vitis vinifera TaxID=29760 RepID=A0A438G418_VITVI|nr:putative disease resistance protein [Vitis vinifera]